MSDRERDDHRRPAGPPAGHRRRAGGLVSRAVRRALWLITVLVVALFGFLWLRAGMDVHYLLRVLIHRDSSTSDYHWKRAATVAPAATPSPWPRFPPYSPGDPA